MRRRAGLLALLLPWVLSLGGACATQRPAGRPDAWRGKLAHAMRQEVTTREQRDQLSRVLVDAVDAGAVEGLSMAELEASFGLGTRCGGDALCDRNGFAAEDWYYLIGHTEQPSIKQLPVLIIGFSPHGYVARVFTLKTH